MSLTKRTEYSYQDGRWSFRHKKKPTPGICRVVWCKRPVETAKRFKKMLGKYTRDEMCICRCHRARLNRANRPEDYAYEMVRKSARKRHISFTITRDEFKRLINGTDYLTKRGRGPEDLQINRKDDNKGYTFENCEVTTGAKNYAQEHERKRVKRLGPPLTNNPF
jgi:hypothetical protein